MSLDEKKAEMEGEEIKKLRGKRIERKDEQEK